jgi:hypothetical protein
VTKTLDEQRTRSATPVGSLPPSVQRMRDALRQAASPLSDCQQRVWRLATLDPAAMWAQRIVLRLSGPLDAAALAAALRALVSRHATLRTVFITIDGEPLQCVRSTDRGGLAVIDLDTLSPAQAERAAAYVMRREGQLAFDVRHGPLMRSMLVRLGPAEQLLSLTLHHLIVDGWSRTVMFRELSILMRAFSRGQPTPLQPLRVQYADFARAEQNVRHAARRAARLNDVVMQLQNRRPPVTLPPDRPRPPHTSHRADMIPFVVPDRVWQTAREVAAREGMTAFMLGLVALALALRLSVPSVDELAFGVAVANRPSIDAQAVIGAFVNIAAVRLRVTDDMTIRHLLRQARAAMLDAFAYQDVPFDRVLSALHPDTPLASYGPTSGEPLFRVCVDFNDSASDGSAPDAGPAQGGGTQMQPGLTVTAIAADEVTSGCDLYVSFSADHDTLRGVLLYSTELYERRTAETLVDRLRGVFASLRFQLDCAMTEVQA